MVFMSEVSDLRFLFGEIISENQFAFTSDMSSSFDQSSSQLTGDFGPLPDPFFRHFLAFMNHFPSPQPMRILICLR